MRIRDAVTGRGAGSPEVLALDPALRDSVTWRLRVRMDDRPGTLARIAIRLADMECNILGLTVLPVPGGVVDEMVVRPATGLSRERLIEAVRAEGCECSGITDADLTELVDPSSAALRAATAAINEPARAADALCEVLAADLVTVLPSDEANPARTEGGKRVVLRSGTGVAFVGRRQWAPFTQVELARADALLALLAAERASVTEPEAVVCADGSALVLRHGKPADADALAAMHDRCGPATLLRRYHAGLPTVPRRWVNRLLAPAEGLSLVGVAGAEIVALGQLIPTGGSAEVSLLVQDSWQRKGVGTALLARLAVLARANGYPGLHASCLSGWDAVRRTALRAGLAPAAHGENGLLRIAFA